MTLQRKVFWLLATLSTLFFAPYIAILIFRGKIPDHLFDYPPLKPIDAKPAPDQFSIIIFTILFIAAMVLLLFPRVFGFKQHKTVQTAGSPEKRHFPIWFYIGLVAWAGTLTFQILQLNEPKWLNNWALIPLWWGFIFILDGIVFYRTGGRSLMKNEPTELFAMAIVSISGWLIFEYFNCFIKLNWYYPAAGSIPHDEFLLYAVLGSSAFIPMTFEWYFLFRTFTVFNSKYKKGPRLMFKPWVRIMLLVLFVVGLFASALFTNNLFYMMWLAPLIILSIVLDWLAIWTPFKSIKERGDWSALLVFAPTFLIQGLLVECWNYLSGAHVGSTIVTPNPAYWAYCIPYVSTYHLFEMPMLGYLGYIPFSIYCWVWWITMAFLLNISTKFSLHEDYQ